MGVSRLQPAGGANDFTLDIGSSGQTVFELTKEYAPGAYSITSQLADATLDVYVVNADGSSSGYTNSKSLTATKGFNKIVVYGATTNDLLIFEYKTTFSPTAGGSTLVPSAAPFVTSVSPSDLPDIDDTTTITGGNFATDVEVTFTGTNAVALNAKSIVRASATSMLVTRPDTLIQDHSPYNVAVANPGATAPTGSNPHRLSNAITAGGDPTWATSAGALTAASAGLAYSVTLSAADPDGGTITYSLATGSLPTGLSLDGSTGVISGTPTGASQTFTIAATDTGGNVTNRSFSIQVAFPTGGTITEASGYRIHTFTSSGTLSVPGTLSNVEYLVVAGGGGAGGGRHCGAGGGGGVLELTQSTLTLGSYPVVVGAGGGGGGSGGGSGAQGGSSSVFGTSTTGGGYGGGHPNGPEIGGNGASAGSNGHTPGNGGTAISGQGNVAGNTPNRSATGGGGGAAAPGAAGVGSETSSTGTSGNGGAGRLTTITGSNLYFGGGGGGSASPQTPGYLGAWIGGNGGIGGGGGGAVSSNPGTAGTGGGSSLNSGQNGVRTETTNACHGGAGGQNSGGGGGGAAGWATVGNGNGGAGGSGVVIVRYPI